jgi:hypothetical protein
VGVEVDVNERGRDGEMVWLGREVRYTVTKLAFCEYG